jgi:hypothetical protein
MAALSWQLKSTPFGAAALMRLNVRLWHGALPIPNVGSSVANEGKADKICSMRVLRILTDSVDKVSDERVEALY